MRGHVVGNLLIVGLWELMGDHVRALDWVGRLLGAHGRVLPMAITPMDITAEVRGLDPARPDRSGPSYAVRWRSRPPRATSCRSPSTRPTRRRAPSRSDAILAADWVVLGPGSWFTSVIPHLMVPGPAAGAGRHDRPAGRRAQPRAAGGGDPGYGPEDHLAALFEHAPELNDPHRAGRRLVRSVAHPEELRSAWSASGARLVVADIAAAARADRHDPTTSSRPRSSRS